MPAYRVEIPESARHMSIGGANGVIVFAADATDAKAAAKAIHPNDPAAMWTAATATEIVEDTDYADFDLHIVIQDSDPVVDIAVQSDGALGVSAAVVSGGGTGYTVNDVVTVTGGTATRAATLRILTVNTGVALTAEVIDPGVYSVMPSNPVAVTGDGNDDATFTLTAAANNFSSLLAAAVGSLNAESIIAGAALDMGDGSAPKLTIADGAGGDDLGDKVVTVEIRRVNGDDKTAIPSLVGTVTDEGAATDVLSVTFDATPIAANPIRAYKIVE